MTNSELYKVTLRDTAFYLDRSQIEFDSPNYFTSCFLGSFAESNGRETRLSRDPALFAIIVNYLSGYTIIPLPAVGGMAESTVVENLLSDALFYGLDELADVLEEYRAGKKAMRKLEEKVAKSYIMVVWPQGMCSRKGQFAIRISETQAHSQCSAHPIPPNAVPMLHNPGTLIANKLLKEQKINAHSWTWAAFWTTMRQGGSSTEVESDSAVLEVLEVKRD